MSMQGARRELADVHSMRESAARARPRKRSRAISTIRSDRPRARQTGGQCSTSGRASVHVSRSQNGRLLTASLAVELDGAVMMSPRSVTPWRSSS